MYLVRYGQILVGVTLHLLSSIFSPAYIPYLLSCILKIRSYLIVLQSIFLNKYLNINLKKELKIFYYFLLVL